MAVSLVQLEEVYIFSFPELSLNPIGLYMFILISTFLIHCVGCSDLFPFLIGFLLQLLLCLLRHPRVNLLTWNTVPYVFIEIGLELLSMNAGSLRAFELFPIILRGFDPVRVALGLYPALHASPNNGLNNPGWPIVLNLIFLLCKLQILDLLIPPCLG
jgi:hypothetical protein